MKTGRLSIISAALYISCFSFSSSQEAGLILKADLGNVPSQLELAIGYDTGAYGRKDVATAFYWYSRAAHGGDDYAQFVLAQRYLSGSGVVINLEKAALWCRKAAEGRSPDAQFLLGKLYTDGTGVTKDESEAFVWFYCAGRGGYEPSDQDLLLMMRVASKANSAENERRARERFSKFGNIRK